MEDIEFTPKTLAAKIGCSTRTIYRWVDLGMPCRRVGALGNYTIVWSEFVTWWERKPTGITQEGK